MHYVIIARDGEDSDAPARRSAVREAHLERARIAFQSGELLFGGALLDDAGTMIGSVVLVDFPDEAAARAWIAADPYVTGDVWRSIELRPFRPADLR